MEFRQVSGPYRIKKDVAGENLKFRLHRHLIEQIESQADQGGLPLDKADRKTLTGLIVGIVDRFIEDNRLAVNRQERDRLIQEMVDELHGFGPLEPLLKDDSISDILVNGPNSIYIERHGKLEQVALRFMDEQHVLRVIQRMLAVTGRRLDESSPMVDARLADGSRINCIMAPLAVQGPDVSIRKFRREQMGAGELLSLHTVTAPLLEFLRRAVGVRCNILVSGGTGAGKTTLLNVMSRFIDPTQRIVVIEDTSELQLDHPHVVRLETRPPNAEGKGEVTARDIVKNVLRMRPDRIVLGEVRGVEVMDMLQSMNTGHDGSMSTLHANSALDALARLEMLAELAQFRGQGTNLRTMITTAIDLVVHVSRMPNGQRKVTSILEVLEVRDGQYVTNEIFRYEPLTHEIRQVVARPAGFKLRDIHEQRG